MSVAISEIRYNNFNIECNVKYNEIKLEDVELNKTVLVKVENQTVKNYLPEDSLHIEKNEDNTDLSNDSRQKSYGQFTSNKPFRCNFCNLRFAQKSHLKCHFLCHTEIKPFKCWKCPKEYRDKATFYKHLIQNHSDEKPFQCRLCEQIFSEGDFLIHQRKHHEVTATPVKRFACRICLKTFLRKQELEEHLKIHRGEKPFQCGICLKCFSRKDILRNHMRVHTGEGLFECPDCMKDFPTKYNLDEHRNIHKGVKSYECPVCAKLFLRRSGLNRHLKIHSGAIRYECPICHRHFSRDIGAHMKIHTGERNFCCSECGKRFFQNSDLSKHMMIHTGEKPYECKICAKRFSKPFNWKRHEQTHNMTDKPYWCPICSRTFAVEKLLQDHIANHTLKAEGKSNSDLVSEELTKPELINIDSTSDNEKTLPYDPSTFSDTEILNSPIKNPEEFPKDNQMEEMRNGMDSLDFVKLERQDMNEENL